LSCFRWNIFQTAAVGAATEHLFGATSQLLASEPISKKNSVECILYVWHRGSFTKYSNTVHGFQAKLRNCKPYTVQCTCYSQSVDNFDQVKITLPLIFNSYKMCTLPTCILVNARTLVSLGRIISFILEEQKICLQLKKKQENKAKHCSIPQIHVFLVLT
jgi:hypothetical protein